MSCERGVFLDVIEDSMIQPEQLEEIFGKDIADAVVSVSRNENEDYMDYVNRAAENPIGKWVKYFGLFYGKIL